MNRERSRRLASVPIVLALAASAAAQPSDTPDWRKAERPYLGEPVQLTFPDRFARAGEQYFDHHTPPRWVVFQAIERPAAGAEASPHYGMYVAKLKRSGGGGGDGAGPITGIEEPIRVSPEGSANTCGWFHPAEPGTVIFGSTLRPPAAGDAPGYSRDRQRYAWQFPVEMDVVSVGVRAILADDPRADAEARSAAAKMGGLCGPHAIFERPGYDAECSFSPDGRFLLYTHVDTHTNDPNLWVYDTKRDRHTPLVTARGYDGGPFFSPDGRWICYRSDRTGNNILQLFLAELAFGDDGDPGAIIGIAREIQLTRETPGKPESEQAVSWCPFFHPSGNYMLYATSEAGHQNYEVFAIETGPILRGEPAGTPRRARVTHAPGFDGLPAFSRDGKTLIWTSQRGAKIEGEARPSSQMWVTEIVGEPAWGEPPKADR